MCYGAVCQSEEEGAKHFFSSASYARAIVGFHYTEDSIAGLNMGQESVARRLPKYGSENYGTAIVPIGGVTRFDWNNIFEQTNAI
jgi:hypothetical protein